MFFMSGTLVFDVGLSNTDVNLDAGGVKLTPKEPCASATYCRERGIANVVIPIAARNLLANAAGKHGFHRTCRIRTKSVSALAAADTASAVAELSKADVLAAMRLFASGDRLVSSPPVMFGRDWPQQPGDAGVQYAVDRFLVEVGQGAH